MMKLSLLVHCDKCGYENFPQHRFCGMCGAESPVPQATGTRPAISRKQTARAQRGRAGKGGAAHRFWAWEMNLASVSASVICWRMTKKVPDIAAGMPL